LRRPPGSMRSSQLLLAPWAVPCPILASCLACSRCTGCRTRNRDRTGLRRMRRSAPRRRRASGTSQPARQRRCHWDCSHCCEPVSNSHQIPRILEVAIREAAAKCGVSVAVIPGDVALQPAQPARAPKSETLWALPSVVVPPRDALERLAALLNSLIGWRLSRPGRAAADGCLECNDGPLA
jgi:pyruvate dehydrogenase (quinone)